MLYNMTLLMNKSIFVGMVIGALAVSLAASAVVTTTALPSDRAKDRANNNLDRHIEAGGAHGDAAQRIKDRLNDGGGCSSCND